MYLVLTAKYYVYCLTLIITNTVIMGIETVYNYNIITMTHLCCNEQCHAKKGHKCNCLLYRIHSICYVIVATLENDVTS